MKTTKFLSLFATILLFSCQMPNKVTTTADYRVVPLPHSIEATVGNPFTLSEKVGIVYPEGNEVLAKNAQLLSDYIKETTGIIVKTAVDKAQEADVIRLQTGLENNNPEAYTLQVKDNAITISGATEAGVFYGMQTLRKSIPAEKAGAVTFQPVQIDDQPRFAYRGMHLDVSRHFFPTDSIKVFIDMLALHNVNTFHWHLTDDQGWRVESKKYPKLTEIGSKRKETVIGRNSGEYDGKPYGGFYTQNELKEIVAYAKERNITVIPEIDLPGHMMAALAAYPELGCTGGSYEVWTQWGVADEVLCAGNPEVYSFIEDILNEVVEIFPSEYIHIGGDECPKVRWEKCPKCQAKIKELGIKGDAGHSAEEYLQSHVITFAENVLNQKGRKIIGWDEILEGGLAPNATVMSWRGIEGGIAAAKSGHDAIMTPTSYLYFDYYQTDDTTDEPLAIGGFVPVERVYSYEPIPEHLTADEQKHILGAQANIWTEYIPTFSHVQYMALPRLAALSEVQWSQPEQKDFADFSKRILPLIKLYDLKNYNYATHIFDVKSEIKPNTDGTISATFSTLIDGDIFYTLDGSEPTEQSTKYTNPLTLNSDTKLRAVSVREKGNSRVFAQDFKFNKATAKPIEILTEINRPYSFDGGVVLVDGRMGNQNYRTGRWIAFNGNDLEAVIDLQNEEEISKVSFNTNVITGDWVYDARNFKVLVSDDGKTFREVANEAYPQESEGHKSEIRTHSLSFDPVKTRFLKVVISPEYNIPMWHDVAKGKRAYLFIDEISVE